MRIPEFLKDIKLDPSIQKTLLPKLVNWQVLNIFLRDSKPDKLQVSTLIIMELNGHNRDQILDKLISRYNKLTSIEFRRQLAAADE